MTVETVFYFCYLACFDQSLFSMRIKISSIERPHDIAAFSNATDNFELTDEDLLEEMMDCEILDKSRPFRVISKNQQPVSKVNRKLLITYNPDIGPLCSLWSFVFTAQVDCQYEQTKLFKEVRRSRNAVFIVSIYSYLCFKFL